ncbi:MAG TPA: hypothetical protein VLJ86_17040, partial [Ramlibacter sp.]|nr:hypothetical protein [Ramlibacter sp.]
MSGLFMRLLLAAVVLFACAQAHAERIFGGPAPLPSCRVEGWSQCIAPTFVRGIDAALGQHCDQYAAAHVSRGGQVHCWQQGSVSTTCELQKPAIAPNFEGANWASVGIVMGGRDIASFNTGQGEFYPTWGPGAFAGPTCFCPANSGLKADATCACREG